MKPNFILILMNISFFLLSNTTSSQNFDWAKRIGGTDSDISNSITTDVMGNVYIIGEFEGTADFDPGIGTYNLYSQNYAAYVCKLDASGNFVWAKSFVGTGARGASIAVDLVGNVYTTGNFFGTIDFDPSTSVYNLSATTYDDAFICKLDASGNFVWAKQIGGAGQGVGCSITMDTIGNVYTSGNFQGIVDFDPGANVFNLSSLGGSDFFISKLDAAGNFIWAKKIGGSNDDTYYYTMTLDAAGNIYTTGSFFGIVDFDPSAATYNLNSGALTDIFVSKLDNSGNFVWAKQIGSHNYHNGAWGITVDALGNVYTTGSFKGGADFDPGLGIDSLYSAGNFDVFVSKLDALGNFVWAKNMGGTDNDYGYSIALDANGNVYTIGQFRGLGDFDPGTGAAPLSSVPSVVGNYSIFISKLDASGNFVWAKRLGETGNLSRPSIKVDAFDNVYTSGAFFNTMDCDPDTGVYNLTSAGSTDIFVHKMGLSVNPITKIENTLDISVYPNPAQEQITIEVVAEDMPVFGYSLVIVDMLGRVVLSENAIKDNQYQINIANIPNGQYVMVLRDKSGGILKREMVAIMR